MVPSTTKIRTSDGTSVDRTTCSAERAAAHAVRASLRQRRRRLRP